jgi:hypothetical protein
MDLWLGSSDYGGNVTVETLTPLLDGARLPKLERLGLMNTELTDELCARVGAAKILGRLKELSFAYGTMSDEGARALARTAAALHHLQVLDVSRNSLTDEGIDAVRNLCPQVITDEQKGDGPDERYVSLSE